MPYGYRSTWFAGKSWETYRDTWIKPILAASDEERDSVRAQLGEKFAKSRWGFHVAASKKGPAKGLAVEVDSERC